ncbi:type II toxin-antitoxin system RelE/ParE family toxin [Desulfobacterota bacterium AH_259_B03_O07]|nr:type II toxin-antitoxin system RelE/ParE family toxin [Desulfobacterota bacterium AH_259_B03_O07]
MARYKILIKPSAVKEIESILPKKDRQRIVARIAKLADNPRPKCCEKLTGEEKYRVRQGWYRIVYLIEDQELVVYIFKVGHRKDIYR